MDLIPVRVRSIVYEARDALSFELERPDRTPLPPVDPGAHIDVHLPNGMMRSYSLSNAGPFDGRYRITVARDVATRGGSAYMHDQLRCGQVIEISVPRNHFRLDETPPLSVFIAGGIGVTPFLPMMSRLNAIGRAWRLHYCVRTRDRAALLEEAEALAKAGTGIVFTNFDGEPGGQMLDLNAVLGALPGVAHVYCCGPTGMLDAFRGGAAAMGIAAERIHFEYFSSNVVNALAGGFAVRLERSGLDLEIQPGQTILHAVLDMGIDVPYSCEEGVCGACETRIISGIGDHRDLLLSDEEKAANKSIMICCSGSKSDLLVLDL